MGEFFAIWKTDKLETASILPDFYLFDVQRSREELCQLSKLSSKFGVLLFHPKLNLNFLN